MNDPKPYGALTVTQFCLHYSISRAKLYGLWAKGFGPRYKQIGAKRLISLGHAEEWINSSDEVAA